VRGAVTQISVASVEQATAAGRIVTRMDRTLQQHAARLEPSVAAREVRQRHDDVEAPVPSASAAPIAASPRPRHTVATYEPSVPRTRTGG
jgi:hypothetical protein